MPKEVSKIGTESPTFVRPITERKDGIEAMFAKQTSKKAAEASSPAHSQGTPSSSQISIRPDPVTPVKRKRNWSASPGGNARKSAKKVKTKKEREVIDLCEDSDDPSSPVAKMKLEAKQDAEPTTGKTNAWESGTLEYVDDDGSSTPNSSKAKEVCIAVSTSKQR